MSNMQSGRHPGPDGVAERTRWHRRLPVWAWILIAAVGLVALVLLTPLIAVVALGVIVTAIVGLSRGSRTWLRFSSRRAAAGTLAGAVVVLLLAGSVGAVAGAERPTADERDTVTQPADRRESSVPATRTPTPTVTPTPVESTREEVVTEAIPFGRTTVEDGTVPRGQISVTTPGQDGQRTLTYRVTEIDGVESAREVISDVVSVQPVVEVTTSGTYDPPPPPAPEPACDANYADACVPIASDVDCAWGSGDGPAYFDGVARVVGRDVYGLDRDGDGWACER